MKTKLYPLLILLGWLAPIHPAAAQGTAFNYSGQLDSGGSPANGSYDLAFTLYNAGTNGTAFGAVTNLATPVSNGLFNVTLDFGGVFNGSIYWLQIAVRTNGGGAFTNLTPLQQILPAPYAIYAPNAGTAASANSVSAANIAGTMSLAQLPGAVVTNNGTGVVLSGAFTGNGALTNLNATVPSTINESNITVGATNVIAPLTVPPIVPESAIGSVGTGGGSLWVAIAGRYAYMANYQAGALQIFDVSTPSAPVSVGSVGTIGFPFAVAVAGRYAYVVDNDEAEHPGTLQIFDVSTPSAPVSVGSVATVDEPWFVAVAGRYAYVANDNDTLQIFDVSAPSAPVSVGSVGTGNFPDSVAVAGRYAYVVNYDNGTLQVFDVSNPSAPVLVGSVNTGSAPDSVSVAGRYAYVANSQGGTLQIFDVSNPSGPVAVGSVGTGNYPACVAVAGRYAYVVNYDSSTLQVFDVSIPSAPVALGSVGTAGETSSVAVSGRYAYVVSESGSLQVFDLGGAYIQQLEAGAMETGTLQTRDTVTVGNNLNVRGGLSASGSALINGGLGVNGSVGIGISPATNYALQVNGSVAGVGAYNNVSDARYKTNITRLTHALDKIMALRGVEYDWRSNAFPQMKFDHGTQLGFVAQEIKQVLPEVVSQDAQGYYSIAYSKVIPVLVEAIKDQQREMDKEMAERNGEIQELKQRLEKLEQLQKNGGSK